MRRAHSLSTFCMFGRTKRVHTPPISSMTAQLMLRNRTLLRIVSDHEETL